MFVFLSPGRTGLMPLGETGVDRDSDVMKAFPIGSDVEVVVLEVNPAGRRIRLSRKAVAERAGAGRIARVHLETDSASDVPLGSLADNLRRALKGR